MLFFLKRKFSSIWLSFGFSHFIKLYRNHMKVWLQSKYSGECLKPNDCLTIKPLKEPYPLFSLSACHIIEHNVYCVTFIYLWIEEITVILLDILYFILRWNWSIEVMFLLYNLMLIDWVFSHIQKIEVDIIHCISLGRF